MKEIDQDDNENDIKNDNNMEKQAHKHNIKESKIILDSQIKPIDNQPDNESTSKTDIIISLKYDIEEKNKLISNLNKSLPKNDKKLNKNLGQFNNSKSDKIYAQAVNESFYKKTKKWVGIILNYMNIKKYFNMPKYKKYRNANGDIVKISKKKISLKKRKKKKTKNILSIK